MDWKKWIASHVSGTPTSLSWVERCFPIPVVTYGVTKYGPADGKAVWPGTRLMTLQQFGCTVLEGNVVFSWDFGLTIPGPDMPAVVPVDKSSVRFAVADLLALRKYETQERGVDPTTKQVVVKPLTVYAFFLQEGVDLVHIEVHDMKEKLDGEKVEIIVGRN